ncbi:MAG: undecaprenyl-diphosphate phosphatase [bacterium]
MSVVEAVLLGIVQGLTEFLPISSSGHLVLAKSILGIHEDGITFEIFVHFGTLIAVVTVYRNDLWQILVDVKAHLLQKGRTEEAGEPDRTVSQGVRLFWLIVVGTVPTAVLGLLFRDFFETAFSSTTFVSGALIFTGLILAATRFAKEKQLPLSFPKSLLVGLAQVVAFFPGVSRSGTTISTALALGIHPQESARYSFLLAVPLILGVTLIKSYELLLAPPPFANLIDYAVGCVAAFVSGLWAIHWLVAVLQKGRFDRFGYYCLAVGILGLTLNCMT